LDDLVSYINADDNKKAKKNGKKAKNSSNNTKSAISNMKNNKFVSESQTDKCITINLDKHEIDVESFKNSIKIDSVHAKKVKKIIAPISNEWVLNLKTLISNNI
jgi:hypothetical protein